MSTSNTSTKAVKVDEQRLWKSSDPQVWAEEFAKVCPEVDQGLMVGWFANAMETAKKLEVQRISIGLRARFPG